MIRQAHTYLVSAMSGATLIAIAIVAFVLLVSAQVFRDFPLAGLGGSDGGQPHISDARATSAPAAAPTGTSAAAAAAQQRSSGSQAGPRSKDGATPTASAGDLASTGTPAAPTDSAGSEGGGGAGGGNQGGSEGGPASSPAASTPGSSGSPGQGSSSSSGGGSGSGSGGSGSGSSATPSGKVTETVNNTVTQVDETVTGGALEKTGVTAVTEGVVNGVAGPESVVGKVVDETVGAVGGLLGGKR